MVQAWSGQSLLLIRRVAVEDPLAGCLTGSMNDFDSLPAAELEAELLAVCAAPAWGAAVTAGRPYPSREALVHSAGALVRGLSWDQVLMGLSAHPRIGER